MSTDEVTSASKNPFVVAACNRALENLRSQCRSLQIATFATDDGFEITCYPSTSDQGQRLTSMASSLQALTEAVAHDRKIGSPDYTLVEAEMGRVLLRRVPGHPFMLLAVFGDEERSGQAISISRSVVNELRNDLPMYLPKH